MTTDTQIAAHLERAATYIENHGWNRGNYFAGYDKYHQDFELFRYLGTIIRPPACALGALIATSWGLNARIVSDAVLAADRALERRLPTVATHATKVHSWNDTECTSAAEAVRFLRDTARALRGPQAGNIGDDQREYEFEPFPETVPFKEPAAPSVTPEQEPVPA